MPGHFKDLRGRNMPYELKALIGSPVTASDGEMGSIRNFLFDDQSWMVRYVAVDVGNWLKRRDVVLPITVLEKPDWSNKTCRAHLTREQVHNSPDVDAEMSVSRQEEIAMRDYFGPLASWVDSEFGMPPMPTGMKYPLTCRRGPPSAQHLKHAWVSGLGNRWRVWNP